MRSGGERGRGRERERRRGKEGEREKEREREIDLNLHTYNELKTFHILCPYHAVMTDLNYDH